MDKKTAKELRKQIHLFVYEFGKRHEGKRPEILMLGIDVYRTLLCDLPFDPPMHFPYTFDGMEIKVSYTQIDNMGNKDLDFIGVGFKYDWLIRNNKKIISQSNLRFKNKNDVIGI